MPRKLVNTDLSEELASFMEDYFVPHLTMQVAKLLRMTASHNRGTVNWLKMVEGVGVLLALADDEQKALVLANLRGKLAAPKRDASEAGFDDSQIKDVFG